MFTVKSAIASGLLAVVGVALAGPASAVAWGSAANPIYGKEDGKSFGKMYGDFKNDRYIYARSVSYQYDLQPGGNNIRVETDFYFNEYDTGCGSGGGGICWTSDVSRQTTPTNDAYWVKDVRSRELHDAALGARGAINLCEVQTWSPDPCSPHVYPTFSY